MTAIRFAQIETTTVCNQRCTFCPVSTDKRPVERMERPMLDGILAALRGFPVEEVYLNGFNEPTYDKGLRETVEAIRAEGYRVRLNTNGSGLNSALCDALIEIGGVDFNVNLSTLDPARYKATRGTNDLRRVVPNVEHLVGAAAAAGSGVNLLVLGALDEAHARDVQRISEHFGDPAIVVICPTEDFAGSSPEFFRKELYHGQLRGCVEGRDRQWLHFTPSGRVIYCCQDYYEAWAVGDLGVDGIEKILDGDRLAQFQRWTRGEEPAPENFLCRYCVMAIGDGDHRHFVHERFCSRCSVRMVLGEAMGCGRCVVGGHIGGAR